MISDPAARTVAGPTISEWITACHVLAVMVALHLADRDDRQAAIAELRAKMTSALIEYLGEGDAAEELAHLEGSIADAVEWLDEDD